MYSAWLMRTWVDFGGRVVVWAALFLECSVAGVEGGGEDGDEDEATVLYLLKIYCRIFVADPFEMLDTTVTSLLL